MLYRLILVGTMLFAGFAGADEPRFSLEVSTGGHPHLGVADEARKALWNDPMARLMRAADAEFGHLLIGQPGGRTPPAIVVGFRAGVPPHIIGASIESNLVSRTPSHNVAIPWPWTSRTPENETSMEEGFALELAERLHESWATEGL